MHRFFVLLLKPLSFLPALAIMYLIFSFSGQTGQISSGLSYKVSSTIVTIGEKVLHKELSPERHTYYIDKIHGPIRKLAHMSEYFLLAVSVSFPLYVYGLRGFPLLLLAGALCVAFACGDEYHQSFVAGRGPSKRDVLIDSIGIFFGITTVRIICWTALAPSRRREEQRRRARARARRKRKKSQ